MSQPQATSRPQHFSISELASYASDGRLRVPEFQRAFRWSSNDVVELFDSIRRGYPVGNALLWKRDAPAARVSLGELRFDSPDTREALWVVDGQQRITSLVNAVNAAISPESVFAVSYLPGDDRFVKTKKRHRGVAIALPDLFDIPRLFQWLQANPDASEHAELLQSVTTVLRDFKLPASVVESSDESELRRIFDRINNAGKRLTAAEVFDAINRTNSAGGDAPVSITTLADRLAAATQFGRLPDPLVYQALMIRRHPDIDRSAQPEFAPERRQSSDFPNEDRTQSFAATEEALLTTIAFLEHEVGIPHFSFIPQQFILLVLTRFFALFPAPSRRNRELLSRWAWRAASRAPKLGLSGSSSTTRTLARMIKKGDEHGSVQRLLDAVELDTTTIVFEPTSFRTNKAASKIMLCALWSRQPRRFDTGNELTSTELQWTLGDAETPAEAVQDVVERKDLDQKLRQSVGNKMIQSATDKDVADWFSEVCPGAFKESFSEKHNAILASHFLEFEDFAQENFDAVNFIRAREARIAAAVNSFIRVRSGVGFDDTPPLESLDLDEDGPNDAA